MRYLFLAGGGLVFTSVLGKGFIKMYRHIKMADSLDRVMGSNQLGKYYRGTFMAKMNRHEASLVLGVRESAHKDKIMKAHRKLMFLNHPDNGGSTYLATKINEAKEVLVK